MILSQSSFQVARTWGLAVVIGVTRRLAYAVTGFIARFLLPWAAGSGRSPCCSSGQSRRGVVATVLTGVASVAILVFAWWATLRWFDLSPYFAKRPLDVWRFLTTTSDDRSVGVVGARHHARRHGGRLRHRVGRLGGGGRRRRASPFLDALVMPTAIALRSVPIIAMTPLIALLFGRGLWGVTVIVGLVTFFPTLVAVTTAMRNAPRQACDLVAVYGGSRVRELFGVRLPFALPALFAASKIALPAAISGALLAEWLATGTGLGSVMLRASASSKFAIVWSGAVLIVIVSIAAYSLVGVVEAASARLISGSR